VRGLPPGAKIFLQGLGSGTVLGPAAQSAFAENPGFDLAAHLAAFIRGACDRNDQRTLRGAPAMTRVPENRAGKPSGLLGAMFTAAATLDKIPQRGHSDCSFAWCRIRNKV
jgi:hypothetical protein